MGGGSAHLGWALLGSYRQLTDRGSRVASAGTAHLCSSLLVESVTLQRGHPGSLSWSHTVSLEARGRSRLGMGAQPLCRTLPAQASQTKGGAAASVEGEDAGRSWGGSSVQGACRVTPGSGLCCPVTTATLEKDGPRRTHVGGQGGGQKALTGHRPLGAQEPHLSHNPRRRAVPPGGSQTWQSTR